MTILLKKVFSINFSAPLEVCVQRREGGRRGRRQGGNTFLSVVFSSKTTQYGQFCFKVLDLGNFPRWGTNRKAGGLNKSKLNQDKDIKNKFGFTFRWKLVLYLTLHKVSCTMKREAEVPYTASLCQRITVVCWQSPLAGLFLLMFNCIFNYRLKPHLDKHQRLGSMSFHYTKKDLIPCLCLCSPIKQRYN